MRMTIFSQIGLALALIVPVRGEGKGSCISSDICDLDGGGRLDLILAGCETHSAVWYRNRKTE